jgi:anti-sigma28 factor (negative regulator of flagellin synthesis)
MRAAEEQRSAMKITDQGSSERITTQTGQPADTGAASSSSPSVSPRYDASDSVQLSGLASRLQSTGFADAARSARMTQIAKAVNSNNFRVDPTQVSDAMVSEAIYSSAR